ncbi:ATP-binding protein [Neptuniibacter sp. 1_MG-2023]|uniref:ATP-binding protein n=1 Tax=Neptuniibacter sp. 1_MG-2023 TaxID=3062662 RepID=UPI0026E438C1|nr:ATP-binding protein [Neptuniibacter sp. 1_MG-2023]MDO6593445.1 ATP-binding protein [Neptuniibacter sp. 1_MG-2023]
MLQENQLHAESNHGSENSEQPLITPYRHRGYKKALYALRDALDNHSAVILKGVEGTGKTTLVSELISDYQHKGVPVVRFDTALTKPSQFYSKLAECLKVPKQKKDLIQALRDTKDAGQYCLVVIDQEAIDSSATVADALKQLCLTSETTAGAIKLIVVRKDYLVIHTGKTPEADFHNWIKTEVTLNPLQIDDIEGYIYYLCAIKGLPPTPYEIGTDFSMIEQTEGRISRLKALLLPLIHKDVITRKDFANNEHNSKPLHTNHSGIFALAFVAILALGVGINHFLFTDEPQPSSEPPAVAVFAESEPTASGTQQAANFSVTPPSVAKDKSQSTVKTTDLKTTDLTNQDTSLSTASANDNAANKSENPLATNASPDLFQTEVKMKLLQLETELTEAKIENNRLQLALIEAQKEQGAKIKHALDTKKKEGLNSAVETKPAFSNSDSSSKESLAANQAEALPAIAETSAQLTSEPLSVDQASVTTASQGDTTQEVSATDKVVSTDNNTTLTVATSQKEKQPLDQATALINRWQNAWQTQNHEDYIFTYTSVFNGPYKTHQRWLQKRHTALTTPEWIKLERTEFSNIQLSDSMVTVDFWINYEAANGYKDKTLKRLTIENIEGEWLISKEQNLEVQPLL